MTGEQTSLFGEEPVAPKFNPLDYKHLFDEYDPLVIEYQNSTNDRERGAIALFFVDFYKPMVIKRINAFIAKTRSNLKSTYKEEGLAIWNYFVCSTLESWTGESSQEGTEFCSYINYLYSYANQKVATELNEKIAFKDMKYSSTDSTQTSFDAINGVDVSQVRAYEARLLTALFPLENNHSEVSMKTINDDAETAQAIVEMGDYFNPYNDRVWSVAFDTFKDRGYVPTASTIGIKLGSATSND